MPCTLASLDFGPLIELAAYNILGNKSIMIEALGLPIVLAVPRCDRFPRRTRPLCKSAVDPCSYRTRTSSPCREAAGLSLRRGDIVTRRGPYDCGLRAPVPR